MQTTCYKRCIGGEERQGVSGGFRDGVVWGARGGGIVGAANINSDGTVLALCIPIPNWCPGAIAFALSHDC